MKEILVSLEILVKSLEQKLILLKDIKDYTKKQSELLVKEEFDYNTFNNIMDNKKVRIDNIISLDEGFVPSYERISSSLMENKADYKEQVEKMKKLIFEINDVQVYIRMAEERNKKMFADRMAMTRDGAKNYRNHNDAYKKYQGIDKAKSPEDTSLFDSRK